MGQVSGAPQQDPLTPSRDSLIGHCPQVDVQVNDKNVRCLIDTGSQITMFSESLCNELFGKSNQTGSGMPWFTLHGANGLDVSYIGYLIVNFKVKGVQVPEKGVVVVRDQCLGTHKALLGMNVITNCWEELFHQQHGTAAATNRAKSDKLSWEKVFIDCHRIAAMTAQQKKIDTARVACRYPLSIPAGSEALVWASLPARPSFASNCVFIEPHKDCTGIEVARTLATVQ